MPTLPHPPIKSSTEKLKLHHLFTSLSVKWATPVSLYRELDAEFSFTLDPCPLVAASDGLALNWRGERVFCNPPYGPEIKTWLGKWSEAELAVYLLPARTDTIWFHEIVLSHATETRFLRGRLRFGDNKGRATFPSMIVVFKKGPDNG